MRAIRVLAFSFVFLTAVTFGCSKPRPASPASSAPSGPTVPDGLSATIDASAWTTPEGAEPGEARALTANGAELAFRWVPAGTFAMGCPKEVWNAYVEKKGEDKEGAGLFLAAYDETPHEVELTQGFWLAETELTQAAWKSIVGTDPSYDKGDELPVECVSWDDAQKLVDALNAAQGAPAGFRFALPTEAQWEYACRAGSTTLFAQGDVLTEKDARCTGDDPLTAKDKLVGNDKPLPVKSFDPNAWGLYDMHGNVWEWCADAYGRYPKEAQTDPAGPAEAGEGGERVTRGGCYSVDSFFCRSARRSKSSAQLPYSYVGIRLALVPAN